MAVARRVRRARGDLREAKETHVPEDVSAGYYRPGALARIARELDHAVERGERT
jgi:hypothetical protein